VNVEGLAKGKNYPEIDVESREFTIKKKSTWSPNDDTEAFLLCSVSIMTPFHVLSERSWVRLMGMKNDIQQDIHLMHL